MFSKLVSLWHHICSTLEIEYSLADGALLGLGRSKNFIPWDKGMHQHNSYLKKMFDTLGWKKNGQK